MVVSAYPRHLVIKNGMNEKDKEGNQCTFQSSPSWFLAVFQNFVEVQWEFKTSVLKFPQFTEGCR